MMMFIMSGR